MELKIALAGNPNCGKTTAFNEYTGAKNTPEYLETCFQIGTLYMNFYTENGNQSLLACTRKAYDYFEQIENADDGKKLSRFEHSSAAHNYYVISKFYKESGGLKLEARRSAQDLEQLLGAFSGCMDYLDTVMRSGQEEDCLRQCMRLADAAWTSRCWSRCLRASRRRRPPYRSRSCRICVPARWRPCRHIWKMWP